MNTDQYQNEKKLERALKSLSLAGNKTPSDDEVKAEYLKLGGRIVGDQSTEHGTDESALIHVVERDVTLDKPEEAPLSPAHRRRGK